MPPVDHECVLLGVVAEVSNQLEKVKYELAQLKKANIGPKSERCKDAARTEQAEERLAERRAQAADSAQTATRQAIETPTVQPDLKEPPGGSGAAGLTIVDDFAALEELAIGPSTVSAFLLRAKTRARSYSQPGQGDRAVCIVNPKGTQCPQRRERV